jgi:hypothetical protein
LDAFWYVPEACHARAPERFGKIMPEVDAVPLVSDAAMQEVGLQPEFDSDGEVVGG